MVQETLRGACEAGTAAYTAGLQAACRETEGALPTAQVTACSCSPYG